MKICLDAGHSGKYNRSPGVPEYYESDMNWKLHLLLKAELENHGFQVITTRENQETDLELTRRGRLSQGCDAFISIHSNAVGDEMNETVDHPVGIYFVEDGCRADTRSHALALLLTGVVEDVMQTQQSAQVYSRLSGRDRDGDGRKNDDYYGVLYGAHQVGTPGVILEHSFHTNTRAAQWLLKEANLQRLAAAEAAKMAQLLPALWAAPEEGNYSLALRTLKRGHTGDDVKALQQLLTGNGFSCGEAGVDGKYGPATQAAVRRYQTAHSLAADGICGPRTMAALLGVEG